MCLLGSLFGSTERVVPRFRRQGETVIGADENGTALVNTPINELVHIRPAYDQKNQLVRINCP